MIKMLRLCRSFCTTKVNVPPLPYDMIPIFKNSHLTDPPTQSCLNPAIFTTILSLVNQWSDKYISYASSFLALGWIYYICKRTLYEFEVQQISSNQSMSKLYFTLNGGLITKLTFEKLQGGIMFNNESSTLIVPTRRITIKCKMIQGKINFKQVSFMIRVWDRRREMEIGPVNIEQNLIQEYNDHIRLYCYELYQNQPIT